MNRLTRIVVCGIGCALVLLVRSGNVITSEAMYGLSNSFYDEVKYSGVFSILGQSITFAESNVSATAKRHNNGTASQPRQQSTNVSNTTYFYTRERGDRVGAAIQDMLLGHAFAKLQGGVYAGACGQKRETVNHKRFASHFGLDDVLPFVGECPLLNQTGHRLLKRSEFIEERNISRLFTDEWLHDMRQHVVYPPSPANFTIAVHIRRGDVSPCHWRWGDRYMPNLFYLDLIELYAAKYEGANVTIFSEKRSYESFDDFAKYNLALDTDPLSVWEALFASDVVILSKSSFSLVPAWLRRGKVVSGPQYHTLLPHWEEVPPKVLARTNAELKRLQGLCPQK